MKQFGIISFFNRFLGDATICSLENRIFNAAMIMVSLLGGITTIYNIILHNNLILTACSGVSVFLTLAAYGNSLRTRKFQPLVLPVIVYFSAIMIISWITNDGTRGASSDFFFLLISLGILLLKKPYPAFYLTIVILLVALLALEHQYPTLLLTYDTEAQRFLDLGISMIMCLLFNGLMIHVVFREYLRERQQKNELLEQTIRDKEALEIAQKELRILKGIVPICANCKMIRDGEDDWIHIEEFLSINSEAQLSHGICPDCAARLYPELNLSKKATGVQ
jgi:hypothetical protein